MTKDACKTDREYDKCSKEACHVVKPTTSLVSAAPAEGQTRGSRADNNDITDQSYGLKKQKIDNIMSKYVSIHVE